MASAVWDSSKAREKLERMQTSVRQSSGIATKHGAQVLANAIRPQLPRRSGYFQESLEVGKVGRKWFVIIRKSKYERIFYPIFFLKLLHKLKAKESHRVKRSMASKFRSWFRSLMRRGS